MAAVHWIGFIGALGLVILIARWSLPLGLLAGSLVLGFVTMSAIDIAKNIGGSVFDPSVVILALAVGLIPMIGGILKESGQMDGLVNNLRIGRRAIMAVSPAIMGLLPMPGGALFSAPVLEKAGAGVKDDLKVAINIWFRHLFILIYPLSSDLIASVKVAGINLYTAILHLMPTMILALGVGYFFFIVKVTGRLTYSGPASGKKLLLPLIIIFSAPAIDFSLRFVPGLPFEELTTLAGVGAAFVLAIILSPRRPGLKKIFVAMRPWNFSLIIFGLFVFLNIFKASRLADLIATVPLPPIILCLGAGFIIGFATGRVLLPASVIFPIYLVTAALTPVAFAVIYTGIYFGYVLSPVHPCVAMTCEYFKSPVKKMMKWFALPVAIMLFAALLAARLLRL